MGPSLLQKDNQGIIIVDEPALHLHPIKQKSFWRSISEWNENQIIAITHSPYLVNLDLFKDTNRLVNIQMIGGTSNTYPINQPKSIHLKDHTFKPTIFFSKCSILVEGQGDEAALAAISDSLGRIFEQYSIEIIYTGGKSVIESYIPILRAYSIPHVVLTDYDYCCDGKKPIPRQRDKTSRTSIRCPVSSR